MCMFHANCSWLLHVNSMFLLYRVCRIIFSGMCASMFCQCVDLYVYTLQYVSIQCSSVQCVYVVFREISACVCHSVLCAVNSL